MKVYITETTGGFIEVYNVEEAKAVIDMVNRNGYHYGLNQLPEQYLSQFEETNWEVDTWVED